MDKASVWTKHQWGNINVINDEHFFLLLQAKIDDISKALEWINTGQTYIFDCDGVSYQIVRNHGSG